uniref:Uncharacterized protein n=1 Tax=Anguilla anguilla TaxID=7936 RepID=A0A0E9VEX2_ANGAN
MINVSVTQLENQKVSQLQIFPSLSTNTLHLQYHKHIIFSFLMGTLFLRYGSGEANISFLEIHCKALPDFPGSS